jgi:hypothetical protein
MRFLLDNLDNDDMEQTLSQTERSHERPSDRDARMADLGRSQELDNEDSGDIADEGSGRRG